MSTVNNGKSDKVLNLLKCCDCNHVHKATDRKRVKNEEFPGVVAWDEVCPECGGLDYYDL